MLNHPAAVPSNYDEWLIDALAKQPADPAAAADAPAPAAARAVLINRANLYQLQAFLEDQRNIRLLNAQNGRGEDALIREAWAADIKLALDRVAAKLVTIFSTRMKTVVEKIPQVKDEPKARDEAGKVANDLRPFYDEKAKARQGSRNDLVNIVEKIPQGNDQPKSRDEAGKVANDLRPFYDDQAKARMYAGRPKELVEKIPQVKDAPTVSL